MKKLYPALLLCVFLLFLSACKSETPRVSSDDTTVSSQSEEVVEEIEDTTTASSIYESPDKYTWYIKNYTGKNCASLGYTSMGGERLDSYGAAHICLVFVSPDGSYIDIESDDALKEYVVTGQNLEPNTELKLAFLKNSDGEEYDNLVDTQSYEEIVLSVKRVGEEDTSMPLTPINPSPDRYTKYISDYTGRNLASCGYVSLGEEFLAAYGNGYIKFTIVTEDGSYVDPTDTDSLKKYVVTGQSVAPNTELKLTFEKNSDGEEYDNLVETQNIEEIELYVKQIAGSVSDTPAQPEASGESEAAPKEDIEENSESEAESETEELVDGMRPEFKDAMDSYEAFYDEYCEFLKKYNENSSDLALLAQYAEMLAKAYDVDEKLEEWDDGTMNDAETKYYLEVNSRVLQKLAEVS